MLENIGEALDITIIQVLHYNFLTLNHSLNLGSAVWTSEELDLRAGMVRRGN